MDKKKYKIAIISLGCPRNLVDSENIISRLILKGYSIVDVDQAEIGIINTCAFIEDAKNESIESILDLIELKNKGKLKKIIIYGCLAQRYKEQLREELPEIDAFIGRISLNHQRIKHFYLTPKHYTYLKICEGCINNCSYCIIPKIKGRFCSLDLNSVLDKINDFEKNKVSEVNIIGQDTTAYGFDLYSSLRLPHLLNKILKKIKNIGWIRLLYLYPSRITDDLLKIIKNEGRVCKYIDLPIQHINSRILRLMRRDTRPKEILNLIDKIRKELPDAAIRTSLIVGFPSETDREFKDLLNFIEKVKFERLGAFIYSREEGTPASRLKKQLPDRLKEERFSTLMLRQQEISAETNKKFLGSTIDVLIEGKERGLYLARSQYDAPEVDGLVYVKSVNKLKAGDFVKVKITDTLEYDLVGTTFN